MRRAIVPLLGALVMALPKPAVADGAGGITVLMCGQPGMSVTIPINGDGPRDRNPQPTGSCCIGACHMGNDRSKRGSNKGACC